MSSFNSPSRLPRWVQVSQRSLLSTRVFDVQARLLRHPVREVEKEFICACAPDWVNVVPVTCDDRIVLVRQFRFGSLDFSLEVPGGVMEEGEDPIEAGLRELAEETGYGGGSATLLHSIQPNPAIQNNRCHLVLAQNLLPLQGLAWDADEELEILTLSIPEVLSAVHQGLIVHSLSLCALLLYLSRRSGSLS